MLTYKSSYRTVDGITLGAVLDFPGTIAYGVSLDDARESLAAALAEMAETSLLQGEPLPIPNPALSEEDAELEEPIYLLLQAGQQLSTSVGTMTK